MSELLLEAIESEVVNVTLVRRTAGLNVRGYGTETVDSTTVIKAAIQPMGDRELRNMPEGQNTLEWWNLWSESELRVRDLVTGPQGVQLTIQKIKERHEGVYFRASATRVTDSAIG